MAFERTLQGSDYQGRQATTGRLAPGPKGHPILGSTPAFWRDPVRAFVDGWQQHGDVVRFSFGGPLVAHLIVHPDHVRQVLQEQHQIFRKAPRHMAKLEPMIGVGLLTSDGDYWLQQRRLIQPAFHRARIAAFGDLMTIAATELMDEWERAYSRGQTFDASAEMMKLTLTVVARALFGAEVSQDAEAIGRAVTIALEDADRRLQSYVVPPDWLPIPANRRFQAARRMLDGIVYRIIDERRRSPRDTGDLLSMLLAARDEETGRGMSDQQVRDEVMTLFLAGHETTANALSWTWYLLSAHPAERQRLADELTAVLRGRPPTLDDLPNLPFTRQVIEESMRLYPPAWAMSRAPIEQAEIGGYAIPKGWPIFILPYLTHRHPDFWENPEGFDPARFAPARAAGRPRFAYFPFGGGPRQCIGSSFAMMEAPLILATIAQRFRLDLVPGHPIALQPLISLRPRYGVRVRLQSA